MIDVGALEAYAKAIVKLSDDELINAFHQAKLGTKQGRAPATKHCSSFITPNVRYSAASA